MIKRVGTGVCRIHVHQKRALMSDFKIELWLFKSYTATIVNRIRISFLIKRKLVFDIPRSPTGRSRNEVTSQPQQESGQQENSQQENGQQANTNHNK